MLNLIFANHYPIDRHWLLFETTHLNTLTVSLIRRDFQTRHRLHSLFSTHSGFQYHATGNRHCPSHLVCCPNPIYSVSECQWWWFLKPIHWMRCLRHFLNPFRYVVGRCCPCGYSRRSARVDCCRCPVFPPIPTVVVEGCQRHLLQVSS